MILEFRENEDFKETVTFSSTVIKLCEALHFFNSERSDVEKKIVQNFHVEKKKIQADNLHLKKKKIHPLKNFYPPSLWLFLMVRPLFLLIVKFVTTAFLNWDTSPKRRGSLITHCRSVLG